MEYYDRTLFEISIELEGYNRRWEEIWRGHRAHLTQHYNFNAPKGKQKKDYELMPLPSDAEKIASKNRMQQMEREIAKELGIKVTI